MTWMDKLNLYFIDFNLIPLLTHENYLSTFNQGQDKLNDIERMANCADLISLGDVISK